LQSSKAARARSAHHLSIALFDFTRLKMTRTAFMARLAERGIGSQVHYPPVYHHPYYAARYMIDRSAFPEAETYARSCLSLPLHPGLTDVEVERVIAAVTELAGGA